MLAQKLAANTADAEHRNFLGGVLAHVRSLGLGLSATDLQKSTLITASQHTPTNSTRTFREYLLKKLCVACS